MIQKVQIRLTSVAQKVYLAKVFVSWFVWRKVGPARKVTLPWKKGEPFTGGGSPFKQNQLFVSYLNHQVLKGNVM